MKPTTAQCITCQKPKAQLECGLCHASVCKYCAHILDEDSFAFLRPCPVELTHEIYCNPCFIETVSAPLADYRETFEKAKDINVFLKAQSKETRLIRRKQEAIVVENCLDEQETLLRLAFGAAKAGFNGLIDVELIQKKVRDGTYQTSSWSGSGIPANLKK